MRSPSLFLCCTFVIASTNALVRTPRQVTIPETNVIFWETLPNTNGVRYECAKPVEDTSVFENCGTEGAEDGRMSRATCSCVNGAGKLYISCYKNGKWYPPIQGACSVTDHHRPSTDATSSVTEVTESATRTGSSAPAKIAASLVLVTLTLAVLRV